MNYSWMLSLVLLLVACSKENRLERQLEKRTGKWDITAYSKNYYVHGQLEETEPISFSEAYMIFDEDGSMVLAIDEDVLGGTWGNTKDQLFFTGANGAFVFDIEKESKDEMTLEHTYERTDTTRKTNLFRIKRKK